jgi:hypothetical protein
MQAHAQLLLEEVQSTRDELALSQNRSAAPGSATSRSDATDSNEKQIKTSGAGAAPSNDAAARATGALDQLEQHLHSLLAKRKATT